MGNLQQRAVPLTHTSQDWCMKTCLEHLRRGQVPGTPGSILLQAAITSRKLPLFKPNLGHCGGAFFCCVLMFSTRVATRLLHTEGVRQDSNQRPSDS